MAPSNKQPIPTTASGPQGVTVRGARAQRATIGQYLGLEGPVTVELVRSGLPVTTIASLGSKLNLSVTEVNRSLDVSRQTYVRRRAQGQLNAAESDRVVRYAQLLARANVLMGDETAGAQWLKTPAPALGNETPLQHATTEMGAGNVERLIGRIEHGIPT